MFVAVQHTYNQEGQSSPLPHNLNDYSVQGFAATQQRRALALLSNTAKTSFNKPEQYGKDELCTP